MKNNLFIRFLFTSIIVFILWKVFFLYYGQLEIVNDPLTALLGNFSSSILNYLNFDSSFVETNFLDETYTQRAHIIISDRIVVYIDDNCNGLELHLLILVFCISYGRGKLNLLFSASIFSIFWFIIFFVNAVRVSILAFLVYQNFPYFDLFHKYVFTSVVYILIFLMMVFWTKLVNQSHMSLPNVKQFDVSK